jgi:hypothetical protein
LIGPASFYAGVSQFNIEEYEKAKSNFELVLDTSTDPQLDSQAESYIEQIANVLQFKAEQEKRFIINLMFGLTYDSNILSVANSQLGTATDLEGVRSMWNATVEYRPIYTRNHEFSAQLGYLDSYSMDTSFAAKSEFQNTDPQVISVYTPYKFRTTFGKIPFQSTTTAGYEIINMNADGSGARENIISSILLKSDQNLVLSANWISGVNFEIRKDTSNLDVSEEEKSTATKFTLTTTQVYLLDPKAGKVVIGALGGSWNNAMGSNQTYNRIDLSGTYSAPFYWGTSWNGQLAYGDIKYSKHLTGRSDKNTAINLGLRKPLSESLAILGTANYTINQSTLSTSDYKKWSFSTLITYGLHF